MSVGRSQYYDLPDINFIAAIHHDETGFLTLDNLLTVYGAGYRQDST